MAPEPRQSESWTAADEAALDRFAARVVALRLETPVLLAVEALRPMGFLASQAMVVLEPALALAVTATERERLMRLLADPEGLVRVAARLESRLARRGQGETMHEVGP